MRKYHGDELADQRSAADNRYVNTVPKQSQRAARHMPVKSPWPIGMPQLHAGRWTGVSATGPTAASPCWVEDAWLSAELPGREA